MSGKNSAIPVKAGLFLVILILVLVISFVGYRQVNSNYYDAVTVTGATPLALYTRVPKDFSVEIMGEVKKVYSFAGSALRAFATTRIRTKEVSPAGEFKGSFIYLAIPVFNILEGVAPEYDDGSDNPLDFLVTFESGSGQQVHFPWAELLMKNDSMPVSLAYSRVPMVPAKEREKDGFSPPGEMLTGFRLIAPSEPDTRSYLDGVSRIIFRKVRLPEGQVPERVKGMKCFSRGLVCMEEGYWKEAVWGGLIKAPAEDWVRVGHGRGFIGQVRIEGYRFRDFLSLNFPDIKQEDYLMLVACDGYRVLYSAREIFLTESGANMLLLGEMNGQSPPGGKTLACTSDFYADRGLWGMSHVLKIRMPWVEEGSQVYFKEGEPG